MYLLEGSHAKISPLAYFMDRPGTELACDCVHLLVGIVSPAPIDLIPDERLDVKVMGRYHVMPNEPNDQC